MAISFLLFLLPLTSLPTQEPSPPEAPARPARPKIEMETDGAFSAERLRRQAREELSAIADGSGGPADVADAAYKIESWIREQGYPEARVEARLLNESVAGELQVTSSAAWNRVDTVRFRVATGEKTHVGTIRFPGAEAIPPARLREFFPRQSEAVFRNRDIEEAVGQVRRLYTLNGYARRQVGPISRSERQTDSRRYYDLTIPVREGPQFIIRDVTVNSQDLTPGKIANLEEAVGLVGEPYFPRKVAQGGITIRRLLGTEGYRAQVESSETLRDDGNVEVTYTVRSGSRLYLSEIQVVNRGERPLRSKRSFLRSFIGIERGEPINFTLLDRAESKLYGLGVFALVDVSAGAAGPRGETPVVIAVRELQTRYVELEAGWGSFELLRGSLTYTDRNLLGRGRFWSTSAEGSFRSYGVSSSITDSLLFGPASTLTVSGAYRYRDGVSFDRTQFQGEVALAYRIGTIWTTRAAYAIERSEVTAVEGEIEGSEDRTLSTGRLHLAAERDTRDSVLAPRRGNYVRLAPFVALPALGSELSFAGATVQATGHQSFLGRFTLSLSGTYTLRYRIGSDDSLPIQERLFLGGSESVRSFSLDTLGLVGDNGAPQGGMSSLQTTAELRSRIVGDLYGALFYDYGLLSEDSFDLNGDPGHAIGGGLRYYLPVGPIRLDAAYNPGQRYAAERYWAIHFAVGLSY